jgi:hypothetical protein
MKLDTSVAPEIALLATGQDAAADRCGTGPSGPAAPSGAARAGPATVGYLARCLRLLLADPQAWWDLVWFDPLGPVHVLLPDTGPGCEAWLLVLPPGRRGDEQLPQWRWDVACLVAGALAEPAGPPAARRGRLLLPGRIRVRGGQQPCHVTNAGRGYAVSLHARPAIRSRTPPHREDDGLGPLAG